MRRYWMISLVSLGCMAGAASAEPVGPAPRHIRVGESVASPAPAVNRKTPRASRVRAQLVSVGDGTVRVDFGWVNKLGKRAQAVYCLRVDPRGLKRVVGHWAEFTLVAGKGQLCVAAVRRVPPPINRGGNTK